jgi:hypothetical protein
MLNLKSNKTMKKTTITGLFILFTLCLFGQDWATDIYRVGEKYPGYIIKNDGTKIEGYIEAHARAAATPFSDDNQKIVTFFSDPKNKKTKIEYKPEDVKEYMIADKHYVAMNYSGGLLAKPVRFLLVKKEGRIKTCVWYELNPTQTNGQSPYIEKEILQKGDEKPFEANGLLLGYVKKMSELVKENPELVKKITNKEKGYGILNYENVVNEYNEWYIKNNK